MPQDPLDRYKVKTTVTNDPLDRYKAGARTEDKPIEKLENVKFDNEEQPKSSEPIEESWWDWITRSRLPEKLSSKDSLNFDEKVPSKILKPDEELEPDTYAGGFGKGLQESLYESIARPMASPLGAGIALAGGPLIRGALGQAAKIPGVSKIGNLLSKEVLPGEAPAFVKKTVESLTPKGKVTTPVDIPETVPEAAPVSANPEIDKIVNDIVTPKPQISPVEKLKVAIEQARPVTREQQKLLSAERGEKFKAAASVDIQGEESAKGFMAKLKGEHTKIVREPLKLDQPDSDSLYKMVGDNLKANKLSVPEGARSVVALGKLLDGSALQPNELELLSRTFGPEVINTAHTSTARELILKTVSIPKSLLSAIDFGWPFRQGFNRIGQKEWFGMFQPMVESYFSESAKNKWIDVFKNTRNWDHFRQNGLAVFDDIASAKNEEVINSLVQNMPGVKHSNRAFNIGSTKLRIDTANSLYDDYMRLYKSTISAAKANPNKQVQDELIKNAELLNPETAYRASKIADIVNTSTGRGSLGRLEPVAEELNAVLFSPALMSSRMRSIHRVLNPLSYASKDPIERKDALKQLASMTGIMLTTGALLKTAGAEVSLDPRSSDFLKGKIGKFRFDMSGGYPQYFVPVAKIMSGKALSTRTGELNELNESPFGQSMFDVAEGFFINKEAPIPSVITSYLKGTEPTGAPVDFTNKNPFENTAAKSAIPIMIQDFVELLEEDPRLLPFMIPSALGGSVAVHEDNSGRRKR